jgi:hypothetical protein
MGVNHADSLILKGFNESGTTSYFTIDISNEFPNGIFGTSSTTFNVIFTSGISITDESQNYHVVSFNMEEVIVI